MAGNEDAIAVPGECCVGNIAGVFNLRNGMAVHGFPKCPRSTSGPQYAGDVGITIVQWRKEYDYEIVRKLISESASVFLANQSLSGNLMNREDLQAYSMAYRAVIKVAIQETQNAFSSQSELVDLYEDLMRMLVVSESAWSFCEICLLHDHHGGGLLHHLLAWLRVHVNDCQIMIKELANTEIAEHHHNYWPAVYGCILQGRAVEVIQLLNAANDGSQASRTIVEVLRRMPIYQSGSSQSVVDFKLKWQHWHQETLQLVQDGAFLTSESISLIAQVLCGDGDAIQQVVEDLGQPWYSALIADLLYRKPLANLHELPEIANVWVERSGGSATFDAHDYILLSALNKNVLDVMKNVSKRFNSWWFAAHFADLLYHAGYLRDKNSVGTTMHESLLLEYASSLMEHESLWPTGALYLQHCKDFGLCFLKEYLTTIPLTSTKKALKVLSLCKNYGFQHQALTISRVMARRALAEDRLGDALAWCRETKDSYMTNIVATSFLEKYKLSQTKDYSDVLDALGSTMLLSKNLLFLAKLREFHQLCAAEEYKEAGSLLMTLLSSRMAPKQYWYMLLLELLPLLESKDILFTTDQVCDMMNCLTELKLSKHQSVCLGSEDFRIAALDLALIRNLARACINQKDSLVAVVET